MGAVNTTYTFTATDTITSTKMNNIIDETVMTGDAVLGGSGGSGGLDIASGKLSISANAINSSRLASSSVTTNAITNGNVTPEKLSTYAPTWSSGTTSMQPGLELGGGITTNQSSYVDFHAVPGTDYESRIIRGAGANGDLAIENTGTGLVSIAHYGAGAVTLQTSSQERMRITASGNVGIGTGSPVAPLHVNGGFKVTATENNNFSATVSNSGTTNAYGLIVESNNSAYALAVRDKSNVYRFRVGADGTVSMGGAGNSFNINAGGNVGVGTTTPSTKLQVNGTVTATAFSGPLTGDVTGNVTGNATSADYATRAALGPVNGTFTQDHTADTPKIYVGGFGTNKGYGIQCQRAANESASALHFTKENGVVVGSIVLDTANSTNYNTTSDYRLKKDFYPISSGLLKVNLLKPTNFKWIGTNARTDGFIAHEVQDVFPNAVTGEKDAIDENGNPIYQQIDQSKLIPIMVAAIQELSRKVYELEAR